MNMPRLLCCVALLLSPLVLGQTAAAIDAKEVLVLAEDTGRWIANTEIKSALGNIWPDDSLHPEVVGYDLASGVSGKVIYFIALYRATGKEEYLSHAKLGSDWLVSFMGEPAQLKSDQRWASLYTGLAGVGVALMHIKEEAPAPRYDAALKQVLGHLADRATTDKHGIHWSEQTNDLIYGDAGTVLFLVHLAQLEGDLHAKELARQGAHSLLARAVDVGEESYWLFRRDKEFNLPNFSHGTAGIAYVLATVGALCEDKALTGGAKRGFGYLRSIAEKNDGKLRIPYGWGSENWQGLYEFGWAHGLTGTSLMFLRMQQLGIDQHHAQKMLLLSRNTLASINLPGPPAAPFAEPAMPLSMRFGRAGLLPLASYWATKYPDDLEVVALRNALFEHIRANAIRDGNTAHWQVDVPDFMGGGRAAYTGLFHGAAGIGLALLNMHARLLKVPPYAQMPDAPY